eukprot:CAMPEP_0178422992 /NCGR_PEP_ID=MMETSP0689_2-20121128/27461_1 /TAXON_ID=160604 /ORGANISM="Amphidinium massartii, Strain CS-259" /LENGTH=493 /DNA_ID=CAMNT_0020044577 /DNA_START=81 /DNA_END=1558 /DNA_ORIENTATION=-
MLLLPLMAVAERRCTPVLVSALVLPFCGSCFATAACASSLTDGAAVECASEPNGINLLQTKAERLVAAAAFKPPASELAPQRGAFEGLQAMQGFNGSLALHLTNRTDLGEQGPLGGMPLTYKGPMSIEDFKSTAVRIAVAVDGGSSTGFILLVIFVIVVLVCITVCFLDPRWLKDSFSRDVRTDAPSSAYQRSSLAKVSRPTPPPRSGASPYTQGGAAGSTWKALPSSSAPPGEFGPRPSTVQSLPAVPYQSQALQGTRAPPASSPYMLERVSMTSAPSVVLGEGDGRYSSPLWGAKAEASVPKKGPPPPLCKALILPHAEARFVIKMESLMKGEGAFEILGLSGRPLLKATVRSMDGGARRFVDLSMTPARSPTLASAGVFPSGHSSAGPSLKVLGAGGAPYGELRQPASGRYSLVVDGDETLSSESSNGQLLFYNPAGTNIATASRGSSPGVLDGTEHLEVRAIPGVDSILVLCCVLAVMLFGGGEGLSPA